MKEKFSRTLAQTQQAFTEFTIGQKVVAILGTAALLLAGFMVFNWAATPAYAPLYSNLSPADASAVIDQLEADGVDYKLTAGGSTIMVSKDKLYSTRISLSGAGLPSSSDSGYTILDNQGLSTSQFQEQTNFKRAMEAELAKTIQALDGVQTAVVHLALPQKQVFANQQDPATASILLSTNPGKTMGSDQVQAVVHLVASSIDGLDPSRVTVADSTGRVLSTGSDSDAAMSGARSQQVNDFQDQLNTRVQTMLDRVVGNGNSTVAVTANLDFDKSVSESVTYEESGAGALSQSRQREDYRGAATPGVGGVVGPDGQMDQFGTENNADAEYSKSSTTRDNAVNKVVEHRETAPGAVRSLHVGVVLDSAAARNVDPVTIENLIAATVGIVEDRGDTVQVSTMAFDRTGEAAAAEELAAAEAAAAKAAKMDLYRNIGLIVLVLLILLLAWLKARRTAKARADATNYVVEQLRQDQLARAEAEAKQLEVNAATAALAAAEAEESDLLRDELAELVERQPEDVAALLRGWLVEN